MTSFQTRSDEDGSNETWPSLLSSKDGKVVVPGKQQLCVSHMLALEHPNIGEAEVAGGGGQEFCIRHTLTLNHPNIREKLLVLFQNMR